MCRYPACKELVPVAGMLAHYRAGGHYLHRAKQTTKQHWHYETTLMLEDVEVSFSICLVLPGSGSDDEELIRFVLIHSTNRQNAAFVAFHTTGVRLCTVLIGDPAGESIAMTIPSRPWRQIEALQRQFPDEGPCEGVAFPIQSAKRFAVSGQISFFLDVREFNLPVDVD